MALKLRICRPHRQSLGAPGRFRHSGGGEIIGMNDRLSRIAKGAAKRGASAAGRGAVSAGRGAAKLAGKAAKAGYNTATTERCPHCGEPTNARDSRCPHCGRAKDAPTG
jgi:rubrerythrin